MSEHAPHFAMLAGFAQETSSEGRRELLRKVTEAISAGGADGGEMVSGLDQILASAAADYSSAVRAEIAKLIASSGQFSHTANRLALDEIAVASPVLMRSRLVNDATLLKVIAGNSQPHMMAVTRREHISPAISSALVTAGDDHVVAALLSNEGAQIAQETFEAMALRAQTSPLLQNPFVRRSDVPVELLNDLYAGVESGLREEILRKFAAVSPEELDRAFQRSRRGQARRNSGMPEDFDAAARRIEEMARRGILIPPALVTLLREGRQARTSFALAFARLADVEFDVVQKAVTGHDLDTISLLCRGAGFDRPLYVTLAIALKNPDDGSVPSAEQLGGLYEQVPVQAAQRALRFWKVRTAA